MLEEKEAQTILSFGGGPLSSFLLPRSRTLSSRISAVGYGFVTGGVMILPNVKNFHAIKWLYLFLIFLSGLMLCSNYRMDLNAIASFKDCGVISLPSESISWRRIKFWYSKYRWVTLTRRSRRILGVFWSKYVLLKLSLNWLSLNHG